MFFNETQFLQEMVDGQRQMVVYLANGFQMRGVIEGHDERAILLREDGRNESSMVYKSAISTIRPYYD